MKSTMTCAKLVFAAGLAVAIAGCSDATSTETTGDGVDASQSETQNESSNGAADDTNSVAAGSADDATDDAGQQAAVSTTLAPSTTGSSTAHGGEATDGGTEGDADYSNAGATGGDAAGGEGSSGTADSGQSPVDPAILTNTGEGLEGEALKSYLADRYEAFWTAYDAARAAPKSDNLTGHSALSELASGEQLDATFSALDDLRSTGQVVRESDTPAIAGTDTDSEHRVAVELVDDGLAEITACLVNDDVRVVSATGDVASANTVTVKSRSTMVRADGTWKLIRSQAVDIVQGVGGCWDEGDENYPY